MFSQTAQSLVKQVDTAFQAFFRRVKAGQTPGYPRKLAWAKRGSKNRRKTVRAVQRQHEHVANQRKDYLHKLSTQLVQTYDGIALENLRVRNMVRNKHLSKSIIEGAFQIFAYDGRFANRPYKTVWLVGAHPWVRPPNCYI